jgi:hypothetical protein
VEHACEKYEVSERRACWVVRQWRGTQRYLPLRRTDEDQLTQAILALAAKYGRYGYRRITVLLREAGWQVGKDRVQRIWRREGLKVPQKQRPRGWLWLGDGSCVRLRPERPHSALGYKPPAPAACSPPLPTSSLSQPKAVMWTLTTLGTKTRSGQVPWDGYFGIRKRWRHNRAPQ